MAVEYQPGLWWHPRIHAYHEENLYFYFVKPRGNRLSALQDAFEIAKHYSDGVCAFNVFGLYDILLRLWMKDADRVQFEERIGKEMDPQRCDRFICYNVDYVWARTMGYAKSEPDPRTIAHFGAKD